MGLNRRSQKSHKSNDQKRTEEIMAAIEKSAYFESAFGGIQSKALYAIELYRTWELNKI